MRWLVIPVAIFANGAQAEDIATKTERYYQERFCAGMAMEVKLGEQRRADCVSETHAIEVDWHDNWKNALGQSMAYSAEKQLRAGLILVCRGDQAYCLNSSLFVRQTFSYHEVKSTLWDCLPIDQTLADCQRWEIGE